MVKPIAQIWYEGFAAGAQRLGSRCPYRPGSPEAELWEDGWTQGMLQREGCRHREAPSQTLLEQLARLRGK